MPKQIKFTAKQIRERKDIPDDTVFYTKRILGFMFESGFTDAKKRIVESNLMTERIDKILTLEK